MPAAGSILALIGLAVLGVGVGAYGTLIGAGGGFVLVPVLLLLFPRYTASEVTAMSLAVVLANSSAGSVSYFRLRRADYRSGIWLAVATLPGAVIGALVVASIPRLTFQLIMGLVLLVIATFLVIRPQTRLALLASGPFAVERRFTDRAGTAYSYRFNLALAMALSVASVSSPASSVSAAASSTCPC